MAKLLYANDGKIELMPDTLAALRALPSHWRIILNARPTGQHHTREIDALIITSRALHVVEFKFRSGVAQIASEGAWVFGKRTEGTSPAIQAVETADAFKTWLKGSKSLRHLEHAVLPWVVLERYDFGNRFGNANMRPDWYYDAGFAKVINGIGRLQDLLLRREKGEYRRLPATELELNREVKTLIAEMGAKPLDALTVQGQVINLTQSRPLPGMSLRICSEVKTSPVERREQEVKTDETGGFTLTELPLGPFTIHLEDLERFPGWRALPSAPVQPHTTFSLVHVYLVEPGVSEEQVQSLLDDQVSSIKADISELQTWLLEQDDQHQAMEERIRLLEQKAAQAAELPEAPDLSPVWAELDRLRAEQVRATQLEDADIRIIAQDAVAHLQVELDQVKQRISQVEAQVAATSQKAENAQRFAAQASEQAATSATHAQAASAASKEAASEARQSKAVQEERLRHEQAVYLTAEERKKKRAEALKLSVIVGAAGSIISMQPIPFADNVILAPMQIWLVVRIGQLYGQSVGQDAALKLIGTLGFGFMAQHATVAMYKLVPGLTFGLGPFTVFGFTYMLGAMAATFYERGQLPDKSERRAVMTAVMKLMKDKAFAADVKEMGKSVAAEFKARGSKTRAEDLQAVFQTASERARPIAEKLERHVFGERE
ncbi:NERD domain-containing protein [Deinococcus taklimakanensis]|uniref:NERD domain-containing protein n=1 Tax=Deinococcus taklimakanensis TaxID=536443 RepID=A0ABW5P3J1_9DEIO